MRILIVDDEKNIREVLKLNLELEGMECVVLADGKQVMNVLSDQHIDVVLLDIMMPGVDGLDICQQIKVQHTDTPVIFLTAKDRQEDKVAGLRRGADDYIVKPFHLDELLLRIQNLARRTQPAQNSHAGFFRFGANWIDFQKYTAYGTKGEFLLTKKEVMLLKLLIENRGEVMSRQQILQTVWGYDVYPSTRTIDNFILSFRKYFEPDPRRPRYFFAVRSVGYKFSLPELEGAVE